MIQGYLVSRLYTHDFSRRNIRISYDLPLADLSGREWIVTHRPMQFVIVTCGSGHLYLKYSQLVLFASKFCM